MGGITAYGSFSTLAFLIIIAISFLPYRVVLAAYNVTPPTPPKHHHHHHYSPPPISERVLMVYDVVQRFKMQITDDPQSVLDTWEGKDVCKYKGFECAEVPDLKQDAVAIVNFNGFGFAGEYGLSLDGFIDELKDVTIFHANSNNFSGSIPCGIADLRYLFELDLSNNKYTKEFPTEVLRATNLTFLDLRFNSFEGQVPSQVFSLQVDVLFINNNNFVQTLPDNLGTIRALFLTFANNNFTGPIPRSIGNASRNLREVLFLNNQLSGCLPYEIGYLRNSTVFDVSFNSLTGPIPRSFGCLAKMEQLVLARNSFYGPIPDCICTLPNLANLSLSYNYFTEVGLECMKLIENKVLDVRMNCIPYFPDQRSEYECREFFHQKHTCYNVDDESSFLKIPCHDDIAPPPKTTPYLPPSAPAPAPAPSFSLYKVLQRHRL